MYLSIDIGASFIKHALMDQLGNIITKGKRPMKSTHLLAFENELYSIIESHELDNIQGIAISCPGTIDVHTGVIYYGGYLTFLHKVNLVEKIESKFNIDVSIENDGKCAAHAELWQGSVKDARNSIVLVLGSGVGGGIIIDGKVYRGVNFSAGEVSYVTHHFDPDTRKGEYVGFTCSAVDMVEEIGEMKQLDHPTDGEKVFEYMNQNDPEAMAVFDRYCLMLANQIMNLQYILDPEVIAIGGGISAQPILIERIHWAIGQVKKGMPAILTNLNKVEPKVVPCEFRNDANLYGALYNFLVSKEKNGGIYNDTK